MKKIYLSPVTETVNVKLYGSILGGVDIVNDSKLTSDEALGKQNDLLFEEDMWESDPWADNGAESYDLWKE